MNKTITLFSLFITCTHMHPFDPARYNALAATAHQAVQHDELEKALASYQELATIAPQESIIYYNCGYLETRLNNNQQAIHSYQQTITLDPSNSHAYLGLSKALLACGEFETAWPLFEHRLANPHTTQRALGYSSLTAHDLIGKRVLLRSEWGLGDMVHFVRYAKLLHEQGTYVIAQTFQPLVPLFSRCEFIDQIIAVGDQVPHCDVQIPMLSLPLIFKTTMHTIPAPIPYIYADPQLTHQWNHTLAHEHRYKIGICWHAKPIYLEDHLTTRRSFPLALFNQLTDLPVALYSLQREWGLDQLSHCPQLVHSTDDFDQSHGRFMDTAALIMNMDLIISADTSIVHIAGALGKEVWVLLPFASEWRWLGGLKEYEHCSPWYPSMKLFRQKVPGDWNGVIKEIKACLEQFMVQASL